VRAEAAYTDASQRLVAARREAAETQGRAHELQVETLRLTQLAEQTRARSEQIAGDLAESTRCWRNCRNAASPAEGRFEELDMQLADSQERHAQLDERVIEAERKLARRASSSAAWSARRRKRSSRSARWKRAAASCSAPSKPRRSRPPLASKKSVRTPSWRG
jgi:chromosome segregation protein